MSTNRTRKEDMWAQSSSTGNTENRTPSSPAKSSPSTSPAKSTGASSIGTNEGSNSTKASMTPISRGSHSGNHSPEEGLPPMPNVSRMSEFGDGSEFGGGGLSMLGGDHQQHADALTRALSRISLHGDTTPRALKTAAQITATN
ncbi:hypothetical protein VC83_01921 [Pseudogymnoascus destructans]|uniref:Uncharacterized protein n=2 Tax=Pseudogymnoascus destructans TaxID=655981 RepID=L8G9V2_PSED2|nr:uncharacterized protein VC83_01921 [Pseudogymnoascus destructans]ELR09433.1 hypothetical protein GMDG_03993 [Pseudogymnoascus destructans 20631-21]OAF61642.1 hypothetical protein VC83_01921 [Pseudogymnoascus destructans]